VFKYVFYSDGYKLSPSPGNEKTLRDEMKLFNEQLSRLKPIVLSTNFRMPEWTVDQIRDSTVRTVYGWLNESQRNDSFDYILSNFYERTVNYYGSSPN
jgi:hypothetical protein